MKITHPHRSCISQTNCNSHRRFVQLPSAQFGQGVVEYAILFSFIALAVLLGLVATGGGVSDAYQKAVDAFQWQSVTPSPTPEYSPDRITVQVIDAAGAGVPNVQVYAFRSNGSYTGSGGRTNASGLIEFSDMTDGSYKFRADYQSQQYWSNTITFPGQTFTVIRTEQQIFPVKVADAAGNGILNVQVYAFNGNGSYAGVGMRTGSDGIALFQLSAGNFKFRADYQAHQYWSGSLNLFSVTSATIETGQQAFPVKVADAAGNGIANVQVYAFSGSNSYTGIGGRTGADGIINMELASGDFKFRADYQAHQYWSAGVTDVHAAGSATIDVGQRTIAVKVTDAVGNGIPDVQVYAFNGNGSYTGIGMRTGSDGIANMEIANGDFKFRADYQAHQYWSGLVTFPDVSAVTIETDQRVFPVKVADAAGNGIPDVQVYAFNGNGSYAGIGMRTGSDGVANFEVASGDYKFRADYQASQYWSDSVSLFGTTALTIETGQQAFSIYTRYEDGTPRPNTQVYAFNSNGSYTGVGGRTAADGQVSLNLGSGSYRFRADTNNGQFWSGTVSLPGAAAEQITVR